MTDLVGITWQALPGVGVLAGVLVAVIEVLKRGGIIARTRAIYLVGFILGQVLAQVAFWWCRDGYSGAVAVDAVLVGLLAAIVALGGYSMLQKVFAKDA